MRCPKCGYISFDLVDECLKCKKNIKSTSEVLQGSVLKVPAPSFLKFRSEPKETKENKKDYSDEFSSIGSDFAEEESEYFESDVDFSSDDAGEIEIMSDSFEENGLEEEVTISPFEDDDVPEGEIEVDLSQFEEVSDPEAAFLSADDDSSGDTDADLFEISVPEELNDMSDLDPPELAAEDDATDDFDLDLDLNLDTGPVDLDLDDLNFDLALDDIDPGEPVSAEPAQETVLALDDIDFSEALSEDGGATGDDSSSMDMDGDLNFDLDLGGLSIHNDK
ncbi:MAG: hypothetical protein ACI8PB_003370 [Desulforhopalus sp.]|jgi:hypothetical protein